MNKSSSFHLKNSFKYSLLFLAVLTLVLILFLFSVHKQKQRSDNGKSSSMAKAAVDRFWRKKLDLKIIGRFKASIGTIYELRSLDKKLYFQVEKKAGKVTYASIGDIKFRETTGTIINRSDAKKIAVKFAKRHGDEYKGFSLDAEQADYYWPKPTHWTFIWHSVNSAGGSADFAKVTIDAISGQVVSFGIGNDRWSPFCLPDKKQAPWAG